MARYQVRGYSRFTGEPIPFDLSTYVFRASARKAAQKFNGWSFYVQYRVYDLKYGRVVY